MSEVVRPIHVLVADDHDLMRGGLQALLADEADLQVVGEASDGAQATAHYQALKPDVVLMDLQMPVMDGVEATQRIRQLDPDARIIVLTTYSGDVRAVRALQAGAAAYLLKDTLRHDLVQTIRDVFDGKRHQLAPPVAESLAAHVTGGHLSQREIEVLTRVAAGHANKAVAEQLGISDQTVKGHMKSILDKLQTRDRTHAVTVALRRGIISLES